MKFWKNSVRNYFNEFLRKISNAFSPTENSICHILGWMVQRSVHLTLTIHLEFSRSNRIMGLGIQGQIWSLLYLSQNGPIATKRKANISIYIEISISASNGTIGLDLDIDLDLKFSRSSMKFAIPPLNMVWLARNKKQTCRLNSRPQMWQWLER